MTEPAKPRIRDGLIKRGGYWYFVLDELRDPATGKRRQMAAEQLGHASVRVTLDTYSHVTPGVQREAVTRVASRFLAPAVGSLLVNEPASATGATEAGS